MTTPDPGQEAAATTEPAAGRESSTNARPDRSGVSVRTRMFATVAVLVALALTGAGAIVYLIESQRIDQQVADAVDQEFQELQQLHDKGVDPETGGRFTDVESLLLTFLARNVPEEHETLVSWYDGEPQKMFPTSDIPETEEFQDAVRPRVETNGSTTVRIAGRELLLSVQSIRVGDKGPVGALVVITDLDAAHAGLRDTMTTYAIVALLSLMLITALAGWQSGRLLAPLRTLRETADEISDTDLSRRLPVRGNDDITALTRTVNRMLERLEAAFVGQREFLDDVGHELKTPLTVMRGHLELLNGDSPTDVAETKELLLEEVDRMARLVGDLVLLAKSDRPGFITTKPVDLADLTVDVLAKARGLGEREWTLDQTAHLTVPLDEQRVTQALLQLCDNAVKHTEHGDVVALGSSYEDGNVRLWVRDSGDGVPAEDREKIFRRFGRSAVRPDDEGFGLGLSIVQAIAQAHGGTAAVEDAEPRGARFVLTLPPGADQPQDRIVTEAPGRPEPRAEDRARAQEELPTWHGS